MKITMSTVFACQHPETGVPISGKPGEVVDLPDAMAHEFIAGGYAFDHVARAAEEATEKERQRAEHNAKKAAAIEPPPESSGDAAEPQQEQPSGPQPQRRTSRRTAQSE